MQRLHLSTRRSDTLVLETKGDDTDRDRTKRTFLAEWAEAVNQNSEFGRWT